MVARGEPSQFTTDPLLKFEPVTVSMNPAGLQYGVEGSEVVDAESGGVIVGGGPGIGSTVKLTRFDISVVVVAAVPDVPETAEPGIWMATAMVPAAVMSEAGTLTINCVLVMEVGVSWTWFGPTFHKSIAPVTKPPPLAVSVKSVPPAGWCAGLRKVRAEEDVWLVKFVLNWEQPPASPNTASAAISHLRETIRTRSCPCHPYETPGRQKSCENNPGAEETSDVRVIWKKPPPNRPVSDTTRTRPSQLRPRFTPVLCKAGQMPPLRRDVAREQSRESRPVPITWRAHLERPAPRGQVAARALRRRRHPSVPRRRRETAPSPRPYGPVLPQCLRKAAKKEDCPGTRT
jgi:hypothetical protein